MTRSQIAMPRRNLPSQATVPVVARLRRKKLSYPEIARLLDLTPERVGQIAKLALEQGLLTRKEYETTRGRKPKCTCGTCRACKNNALTQARRLREKVLIV